MPANPNTYKPKKLAAPQTPDVTSMLAAMHQVVAQNTTTPLPPGKETWPAPPAPKPVSAPAPGGGGAPGTYGGEFGSWLDEAQKIGGFDDATKAALHNLGMQESGGRNIPQGIVDINSQSGDPAYGPLQVIGKTFRGNAMPGYEDRYNPVHSILAAWRYAMARYGHIPAHSGY